MKKHINLILAGVLSLAVVSPTVFAQTAPKSPPSGGTFEQRLSQRKNERKVQLDDKAQKRLSQRCTRTQMEIRDLQQTTSRVADKRKEVYNQIDGKIWVTIGRLKLAEVDTFALERQHQAYIKKVDGFHAIMEYYQQTLDDIAVINCQSDVVGFKALVDTARIYHKDLRARSSDIRTYVIDEIKPALNDIQDRLAYKGKNGREEA